MKIYALLIVNSKIKCFVYGIIVFVINRLRIHTDSWGFSVPVSKMCIVYYMIICKNQSTREKRSNKRQFVNIILQNI